ncbi:MAG: hypothetical protein H3C39_04210 [Flavobacteriia bacterium]|nr:hypothetical protein [Flavobacteriia bacterium]
MRKLITVLLLLIVTAACVNNQIISKKKNLSISFTCCFKYDRVSLYINDFEIFKDLELVSDQILSITPVYVLYSRDGLFTIYNNSEIIDQKELKLTNKLIKITVEINGQKTIEEIDLSKGHIIINGTGAENRAIIGQHRKPLILD